MFWGSRGARETTRVGSESEVGIPLQIAKWMAIIGDLLLIGIVLIGWLIWLYTWTKDGKPILVFNGFLRVAPYCWVAHWGSWLGRHYPLLLIPLIIWPMTAPAGLLLIKFALEQIDKHWPPVESKAREQQGPMGPFYGLRQMLGIKPIEKDRPGGTIHRRYEEIVQKGSNDGDDA